MEFALRERDLEGMPRVEMISPIDFFEDMEKAGGPVNTWDGELYFSAHRGTYTTQAAVKANNRRSEFALHNMEVWGALAMRKGRAFDQQAAERLWKVLLLHQFHDILPGSSIGRVYQEANEQHRLLQAEAASLAEASRKALLGNGEGVTVFNSLGFDRDEVIDLPEGFGGAQTLSGEAVPAANGKALVHVLSLIHI